MATIDLYFSELKSDLKREDLTIEQLEEILFNFGFEIDDYNKETDELKIDITAERIDLLSYAGFLRGLKAYLGEKVNLDYKLHNSKLEVNIDPSLKDIWPYTVSAIIKNLKLDDEKLKDIIRVQEKLHVTYCRKRKEGSIGIYPFEKIKFPIKFIALSPSEIKFIPLGETKLMSASEILKTHPTGIEYAHLLEAKEKYPVFIDANNAILSMPPIINSSDTGRVTTDTKEIFIECSGNDINRLKNILNILTVFFSDIGGELNTITINYPSNYNLGKIISPNLNFEKRIITIDKINSLLGIVIDTDTAVNYLNRMLYIAKKKGKNEIEVLIPPFRSDVLHEVDIIDDIARAYGFSNIKLREPQIYTISKRLPESIHAEDIRNTLSLLGLTETMPLTLSSIEKCFNNFNLEEANCIKLGYTKDKTLDVVVNWFTPKLFDILRNNQHKSYPQKIFVCDYVVRENKESDIRSDTILKTAAVISNPQISFNDISSVLYSFCNILGYNLELKTEDFPFLIKGRSATVIIDGRDVGFIGEFSPEVLAKNNYLMPVCGFEIEI
ncbi:MAG: phenylalanine--tRNA ligase subunit beta [archaeon]